MIYINYKLVLLEINNFKLVSKCKNGGSCIFVDKKFFTREITFLKDMNYERMLSYL
jgi:hypothetical protein